MLVLHFNNDKSSFQEQIFSLEGIFSIDCSKAKIASISALWPKKIKVRPLYCQTPVPSPDFSLGLGVDFVLPLSQQEQQEQQEEEQPLTKI